MVSRRKIVQGMGASIFLLSGCAQDPPRFEIGSIGVLNKDSQSHRVELKLKIKGKGVIYRASQRAQAMEGETAGGRNFSQKWPSEPKPFVIAARTEGMEKWITAGPETPWDYSCHSIFLFIEENGELMIMAGECESATSQQRVAIRSPNK